MWVLWEFKRKNKLCSYFSYNFFTLLCETLSPSLKYIPYGQAWPCFILFVAPFLVHCLIYMEMVYNECLLNYLLTMPQIEDRMVCVTHTHMHAQAHIQTATSDVVNNFYLQESEYLLHRSMNLWKFRFLCFQSYISYKLYSLGTINSPKSL